MDEKVVRALVEAGAIRQMRIIADQRNFYVEIQTSTGRQVAQTHQGKLKTWTTLNSVAKWIRSVGFGEAQLLLTHWTPEQKSLPLGR